MRIPLVILGLFVLGSSASAEKPVQEPVQVLEVECSFQSVWAEINFGMDPQGGTTMACDPGGGGPVWEWGTDNTIPPPPPPYGPNVWGTVIGGDYPNDSGEGVLSGLVTIEVGVNELIELVHYVDAETNYDGGNALVLDASGETVVAPIGGYPGTISTSTSYYAWCVDQEEGFTGHVGAWTVDCFDVSAWDGQEIRLRADFGSDRSVTYPGWFIAGYRMGTDIVVPVEQSTWGQIKKVYK